MDENLAGWKLPLTLMGIDVGYTVAPAIMPDKAQTEEILKKLEACGIYEEIN